jgi:capsular polysaccharide transport system permease protein
MIADSPTSTVEVFARGAVMNGRVLVALIFREAALRFGAGPFSYAWTLVEPSMMIALMLFIRIYIRDMNPAFGESSTLFLLTGLMSFRMARNVINKAGRAIVANSSLFDFGLVKPIDTVIARTTVEYIIWIIILTVFFTASRRILGQVIITNFQGFVLTLLLIYYFCLSVTMFNATVGALVPIWRNVWKIMSVPLLLMSGVLYVPATMPPEILNVIIWNPFLHCVEGIRSTSYLDFITVYDPVYLFTFSTIVLLISLMIESLFRREIIKSRFYDDDEDELV